MFSPTFSFKSTINPLTGTQKRKTIENHYNKMVKFAKKLMRKNRINEANKELLKAEINKEYTDIAEQDMAFQKLLMEVLKRILEELLLIVVRILYT